MTNAPIHADTIRQRFNKAAKRFHEFDFLEREMAMRLLEDLQYIKFEPKSILDLGCGAGACFEPLQERFPNATIIGLDFAVNMLKQSMHPKNSVCGDALTPPFKPHTFDLIWSNGMLHHSPQILEVLHQARLLLKPEGLFLFSILGPGSLQELRQAWARVDDHAHVHAFMGMHDFVNVLSQSGFINPHLQRDLFTAHYKTLTQLTNDLKHSGKRRALFTQNEGLTTQRIWEKVSAAYERIDNILPLTFEIITGHAWGFSL